MWAQEVTLTGSGTQRVQVNLREIIVSAPPKNVVPQNASSQKQTSRPVAPSQDRTNRPRPQPEPVDRKPDRAIINIELTNPEEISEAFIYINDTLWQGDDNIAPAQIKLPLGNYIIEVRKDGYRSAPPLYSLDVVGGESRTFSFILLPN